MIEQKKKESLFSRMRRYFLSGLIVFLPTALTVYILILTFEFADGLLGRYLEPLFFRKFGFYVRGVSIVIGIYFIMFIGFVATNFFGRKLYQIFENLILKLPFFRQVYPPIKEIAIFLFSREKVAFTQVVLIEYPRKDVYSLGFLTNENNERVSKIVRKDLCNVFIPTTPSPLTGFVVMVPRKEVTTTDISVEDAIKFIASGGVFNAQGLPQNHY